MSDSSMDAIKNGTKLPTRPNNDSSSHNGNTSETRSQEGVRYEQFTFHDENKSDRKNNG